MMIELNPVTHFFSMETHGHSRAGPAVELLFDNSFVADTAAAVGKLGFLHLFVKPLPL